MKRIGIDQSTDDIYESSNVVWYSVWPATPVVSVAAFVDPEIDPPEFEYNLESAGMVFREDSFDPVTRIRRGRFYKSSGGLRPSQQYALPHPIYRNRGSPIATEDGRVERWLFMFDQLQCTPRQEMVAVGSSESLWRVLGAERITTGEYLVTLKARHALGVLPELNPDAVPDVGRTKAIETYEKLIDSVHQERLPAPSWTERAMSHSGVSVPGRQLSTTTNHCNAKTWESLSRKSTRQTTSPKSYSGHRK